MILFGHLGLTYAAAAALDKGGLNGRLKKFNSYMDYRLVFVGSILPDLLDKLTIFLIGDGSIHSGRIFAHSLLFVLLIASIGLLLWKKSGKPGLLILAFGSLIHLLLDSMWLYPDTLFWPVYDILLMKSTNSSFLQALTNIMSQDFNTVSAASLRDALLNPFVGIPELTGLIIIGYLSIRMLVKRQLMSFLKTGRTNG